MVSSGAEVARLHAYVRAEQPSDMFLGVARPKPESGPKEAREDGGVCDLWGWG